MSSHLKAIYNQLRIPEQDQRNLTVLHDITNYDTLKAKQYQLEEGKLENVNRKAQEVIAVTLSYLDSLKCSGDPLPRFNRIDWIDFCIKNGDGTLAGPIDLTNEGTTDQVRPESSDEWMDEDDDESSDDDRDAPRFNPVCRKKVPEETQKASSNNEREPFQMGKFELMDQSFDPHPSDFDDGPTDDEDDDSSKLDVTKLDHIVFEGRCFVKGQCYYAKSGKGDILIVGIKSFRSKDEANCVRVIHAKETFLGTGLYGDVFLGAVEKYYHTLFVQVEGADALSLSELDRQCASPHPDTLPILVYKSRKPGSSQSFGYYKDPESIKRVRIRRKEIRMMEGFSGAGGMHLGYKEEGFTTVKAVEMNQAAVQTFQLNNPGVGTYEGDINEFIKKVKNNPKYSKSLGRIDAVHVSSPCQGFSKANRNGGSNDNINNELSYTFVEFLRISGALVGVFENVAGMWSQKGMPYLRKLLVDSFALGYQIRVQILRACDYGDPQKRPRLIIFAAKNHVLMPERPRRTHGPGKKDYVTTKAALEYLQSPIAAQILPNMEPNHSKCTYKPNDSNYIKLDGDSLAPAVLASGPPTFHYAEDRLLNVREIAALQSFPFDYKFCGNQTAQKKQAGNAVPVEFARAIARVVRDSLRLLYVEELQVDNGDGVSALQAGLEHLHVRDPKSVVDLEDANGDQNTNNLIVAENHDGDEYQNENEGLIQTGKDKEGNGKMNNE